MNKAMIEAQGEVAYVRITNGVTNALIFKLIEDLSRTLEVVKKEFREGWSFVFLTMSTRERLGRNFTDKSYSDR